jgi:RNA polymerase sigma factor (sigma-70 family)
MSYPVAQFDAQFCVYRTLLEARARRSVRREDAEDLVCLCYLEARKSLAHFHADTHFDHCHSRRGLLAWLIGVLDNLLHLHFRQARMRHEDLYADPELLSDGPDSQTARSAHQEAEWQRLRRRMGAVDLTARQYECVLRTLNGETQQQIADSLHISQRMVSYHLQAAQQHFSDYNKANEKNNKNNIEDEEDDFDALDFFCQCADKNIYRKPHSFDNQSTSEERESRRYACLREEAQSAPLARRGSKPL